MKQNDEQKKSPYIDINSEISLDDFFEYLREKKVSNKCQACGKLTLSGVVALQEGQSLALNVINKEMSKFFAYECVGRICLSCGHVQLFWTNMVRDWKIENEKIKNNNE